MTIFLLVREDISQYFVEQRSQLLRGLARFGRIFSQVLKNRPEIDERAPIDIAEVR